MLKPNDLIELTPGPWEIGIDQTFEPGSVCIYGTRTQPGFKGAVVCRIAPSTQLCTPEDHANAILMRAAPEFRVACQELLAVLPKTAPLVARVGPAVEKLRALIEKTDPNDYDNMLVATCPGEDTRENE